MTIDQFFRGVYTWAAANDMALLLVMGLAYPVLATLLSMAGKGGRTDTDGKFLASLFLGGAILYLVLAVVGIWIAVSVYDASLLGASIALVVTPPLCLLLTIGGIKWVFPLNQLATVRTAGDMLLLLLLCGGLIWFFSKFRGWGILFFGSFLQLIVILGVVFFFIRRVFKRAFGLSAGS